MEHGNLDRDHLSKIISASFALAFLHVYLRLYAGKICFFFFLILKPCWENC